MGAELISVSTTTILPERNLVESIHNSSFKKKSSRDFEKASSVWSTRSSMLDWALDAGLSFGRRGLVYI